MKKVNVFLIGLVTLGLTSCGTDEEDYTETINVRYEVSINPCSHYGFDDISYTDAWEKTQNTSITDDKVWGCDWKKSVKLNDFNGSGATAKVNANFSYFKDFASEAEIKSAPKPTAILKIYVNDELKVEKTEIVNIRLGMFSIGASVFAKSEK